MHAKKIEPRPTRGKGILLERLEKRVLLDASPLSPTEDTGHSAGPPIAEQTALLQPKKANSTEANVAIRAPEKIMAGEPVTFRFDALTGNPAADQIVKFEVDWNGDGRFDRRFLGTYGSQVTRPFARPGEYETILRVTDKLGNVFHATHQLTVAPHPFPKLKVNAPTTGTAGEPIEFQFVTDSDDFDEKQKLKFYIDWNGDGRIDRRIRGPMGTSVARPFARPGQYDVHVVMSDNFGRSETVIHPLTVQPSRPPTEFEIAAPREATAGDPITFGIRPASKATTDDEMHIFEFDWNNDGRIDRRFRATLDTKIARPYHRPGDYTLSLTLTNEAGAKSTAVHRILVRDPSLTTELATTQALTEVDLINQIYAPGVKDSQTVAITPGTYEISNPVRITRPITLVGHGVTIKPIASQEVTIENARTTLGIDGFVIGHFDDSLARGSDIAVTLDGFTFEGLHRAIYIKPSLRDAGNEYQGSVMIRNTTIERSHYGIRGNALSPFKLNNLTVRSSTFRDILGYNANPRAIGAAIEVVTRMESSNIIDNDMQRIFSRGITLGGGWLNTNDTMYQNRNLVIQGNVIKDVYSTTRYQTASGGTLFAQAMTIKGTNAVIEDNWIERVYTNSVQGDDALAIRTTVADSRDDDEAPGLLIRGNTIINAAGNSNGGMKILGVDARQLHDENGEFLQWSTVIDDNDVYRTETSNKTFEFPDGDRLTANFARQKTAMTIEQSNVRISNNRLYHPTTLDRGLAILLRSGTNWEITNNDLRGVNLNYGIRADLGNNMGNEVDYTYIAGNHIEVTSGGSWVSGIMLKMRHDQLSSGHFDYEPAESVNNVAIHANEIGPLSAAGVDRRMGIVIFDPTENEDLEYMSPEQVDLGNDPKTWNVFNGDFGVNSYHTSMFESYQPNPTVLPEEPIVAAW